MPIKERKKERKTKHNSGWMLQQHPCHRHLLLEKSCLLFWQPTENLTRRLLRVCAGAMFNQRLVLVLNTTRFAEVGWSATQTHNSMKENIKINTTKKKKFAIQTRWVGKCFKNEKLVFLVVVVGFFFWRRELLLFLTDIVVVVAVMRNCFPGFVL